jgi:hypothetical protein
MKFLAIIGALLIQGALSQTIEDYKNAQAMANIAEVVKE